MSGECRRRGESEVSVWVGGCLDNRWIEKGERGWVYGRGEKRMDVCMYECMGGWMDGRIDRWEGCGYSEKLRDSWLEVNWVWNVVLWRWFRVFLRGFRGC